MQSAHDEIEHSDMTDPRNNKTLLGMPSELQAVLKKLKEDEERAKLELAATQPPHAHGQHSSPAQPKPLARADNLGGRTLLGIVPVDTQQLVAAAKAAAAAKQARDTEPASQALRLEVRQVGTPVAESQVAPSRQPPRAQPTEAQPAVAEAPRLGFFEDAPALPKQRFDETPRLSLSRPYDTQPIRRATSPKRWPALSLIGLALVAAVAVIVTRAPQLVPPPLAAVFGIQPPVEELVDEPLEPAVPPPPPLPAAQPALALDLTAALEAPAEPAPEAVPEREVVAPVPSAEHEKEASKKKHVRARKRPARTASAHPKHVPE